MVMEGGARPGQRGAREKGREGQARAAGLGSEQSSFEDSHLRSTRIQPVTLRASP